MQVLGTPQQNSELDTEWRRVRMDDIDGQDGLKLTRDINGTNSTQRSGEGYVRTIDGQATGDGNFGTTSFIDFAVSWNYLTDPSKGNTALGKDQIWNVAFGSISGANDHNFIGADIAGGASPGSFVTTGWASTPASVPEPATMAIVGANLCLLHLIYRRRRARCAMAAKHASEEPLRT